MFPPPFARLFGIKSASFANEQYRNQEGKAIQRRNSYQKVIICPIGVAPPNLCLLRRKSCAAGGRSSFVTAVRFLNGQEAFPLTTAAQNIPVFLLKLPLLKRHFFEWLKTAVLLIDCETVTLKSPPSRAFSVPDVHPRLRKCPPRCTLDCGFQTPESPALRGFEAERCPITGTSLYLAKIERPSPSKNPA